MKNYFIAIIIMIAYGSYAQTYEIHWKSPANALATNGKEIKSLRFESDGDINYDLRVGQFTVTINGEVEGVSFTKVEYVKCSKEEDSLLTKDNFSNRIDYKLNSATARHQVISYVTLIPIVKGSNGQLYKIKKFNLNISVSNKRQSISAARTNTVGSSVLASGDWYKVSVSKSGVFRIDYNYLKNAGIDVDHIDPKTLQVFGFGGMLPERNSDQRYDDLPEIPVRFVGNADQKFESNEYILVYFQGPDKINYRFNLEYSKNIYSDKAFYYITHSKSSGKRVTEKEAFNSFDIEFDDYDYIYRHEKDEISLLHSGRDWVGESLVSNSNLSFAIPLPELSPDTEIKIRGLVQGSNTETTTCAISFNGVTLNYTLYNKEISSTFNDTQVRSFEFSNTTTSQQVSGNYNLNFRYNRSSISNKTHLDYFEIIAKAKIKLADNLLEFRNIDAIGYNFSKYTFQTSKNNVQVWDVTNIDRISSLPLVPYVGGYSFTDSSLKFTQYIAVDMSSNFESPSLVGKIENQDLHGKSVPHLLIVTHSSLKDAAQKLANFRRSHSGYEVEIVTTEQIYNEFSSGAQDISAIRDFAKMLYNKDGNKFKWVLLFGSCSYDYKDRKANNTNLVPVYETPNTYSLIYSYSSDDYFGLLDENEGGSIKGSALDVGIGRLPARNINEANNMVDKIIHYSSSELVLDKWKNNVTFISDDGDGNLHMDSSEKLVNELLKYNTAVKINKLYIPLFPEVASPIGQESPILVKRLTDEISRGSFVLNYSGHGRETGWAAENIMNTDIIKNLTNKDRLFLMITATCEFGRYDDPDIISGVQEAIWNANGGAIATIGPTRPVYASSNFTFNISLLKFLYEKQGGDYLSIGEIIRRSKNDGNAVNEDNIKNYGLMGDPSMTLCYPKHEITIDSIIDENSAPQDTLKALSKATVIGSIKSNGSLVSDFNGEVTFTLYDKEFQKLSKFDPSSDNGHTPASIQKLIKVRESVIYQGKASVEDGRFNISFIVPKDISYLVGNGLMLTYAKKDNSIEDAAGGYLDFFIGDAKDGVEIDNDPPVIVLKINDSTFENTGIASKDILFIAEISDASGINLSRSSVGHEIVMTLDGDSKNSIILNDYYISDKNSFNKGRVEYPLNNLSPGIHTITLKVWDVYNNSSVQTIQFEVSKTGDITIGVLDNVPSPYDDFSVFSFSHNRPGEDLIMRIEIIDAQGNIVRELFSDIPSSNTVVSGVNWQTKINQSQYNTSSGLYVYRLLLKSKYDGSTTSRVEKLVFIK